MSDQHQTTQITSDGTSPSSTRKSRTKRTEEKSVASFNDEDMAFDREIERRASEQVHMPADGAHENIVRSEREQTTLLRDFCEEYSAASSIAELEGQIQQAKSVGADSIEATPFVIHHFVPKNYALSFFMYKDIRVYFDGKGNDGRSAETNAPKGW